MSPGRSKTAGLPTLTTARLLLAVLVTAGAVLHGSGQAAADVLADPWQLYMDTASRAISTDDMDTATIMLETARGTAFAQGGDTARYRMANLELFFVLQDKGRVEQAKAVTFDGWTHFDQSEFDDRVLDEADTLRRFADGLYQRSKITTESHDPMRQPYLIDGAIISAKLEVDFRRTLVHRRIDARLDPTETKNRLAEALTWLGRYSQQLGDIRNEEEAQDLYDQSVSALKEAIELWQNEIARLERLQDLDKQFPAFQTGQAFGKSGYNLLIILNAKNFLTVAFTDRALNEMNDQPVKALDDVNNAISNGQYITTTAHQIQGGDVEFGSADKFTADAIGVKVKVLKKNKASTAEVNAAIQGAISSYELALKHYIAYFGPKADETRGLVSDYRGFLDEQGLADRSHEVANRFAFLKAVQ